MKLKLPPVLLFGADAVALLLAFCVGYLMASCLSDLVREEFMRFGGHPMQPWLWLYVAVMSSILVLFASRGHYHQRSPWWEQVKYMFGVCLVMMLLSGSVLYMLKLPFSRLWVMCTFLLLMPLLVVMRLIVRKAGLALGWWGTDVTIIGGPQNVLETIFTLNSDVYNLYNVREIHLLGTNAMLDKDSLPTRQQACKQSLTRTEALPGIVKKSISTLFIAAPDESTRLDMVAFTAMVQDEQKDVAFVPPMTGMSLYGMDVQHFFGSHTVLLKPKRRVEKPLNRIFKRLLDLVGAFTGILLLAGPIMVIALMIRRDGGSVFYNQVRVGRHGKPFKCWKLRSMVPNATEVLKDILANDPQAKAEWDADFKLKNDPRVTKVGNIIRKTSIDELPQLWNVIKGEMSLVGPRPIVTKELEYYGKSKADYLAAKPGLTGLWQVSGRNDTSYAYRVYLDSWYVAHWSIWTDIVIIVQTVGILMNRKGAY